MAISFNKTTIQLFLPNGMLFASLSVPEASIMIIIIINSLFILLKKYPISIKAGINGRTVLIKHRIHAEFKRCFKKISCNILL